MTNLVKAVATDQKTLAASQKTLAASQKTFAASVECLDLLSFATWDCKSASSSSSPVPSDATRAVALSVYYPHLTLKDRVPCMVTGFAGYGSRMAKSVGEMAVTCAHIIPRASSIETLTVLDMNPVTVNSTRNLLFLREDI